MSLTSKEAAETLSDVERAARRSGRAYGYQKASPHFLLWGVVWFFGYGGSDLYPRYAGYIWLGLLVAASIASFLLIRCTADNGQVNGNRMRGWRNLALIAIAYAFIMAVFFILGPVHGAQQGAFISLLVAAVYTGMGLWLGARFVIAGILLAALTLGGYFYLHEHFALWMAFAGGGALILAGFWLRKV